MTKHFDGIVFAALLIWADISPKVSLYSDTFRLQIREINELTGAYHRCVQTVQKCEPLWGAADKDVFCHAGECMLLDNHRYVPEPQELR